MDWKQKAAIQNIISYLPNELSYATYYWIQRNFGSLKQFNPLSRLTAGINLFKLVQLSGESGENKIFYELGTGRAPISPLAFWLMGAQKTITIDLNPYVKNELIIDSLKYIQNNRVIIENLFGTLLYKERLDSIIGFAQLTPFSFDKFLDFCSIEYIAPGDATLTRLEDNSIDIFTSNAVFEHIPKEILKKIIQEGNRIIKNNGLFINNIDYSDHFSHSDKTISAINFLQFSEKKWKKYAGNRYMYMNRLRHDDYIELFKSANHEILKEKIENDQKTADILKSGSFCLDDKFKNKTFEILSIRGATIISRFCSI